MHLHKPDWREMLRRAKADRWLYEEIQLVQNAFQTLEIEAERVPTPTEPADEQLLQAAKERAASWPKESRPNREPKPGKRNKTKAPRNV